MARTKSPAPKVSKLLERARRAEKQLGDLRCNVIVQLENAGRERDAAVRELNQWKGLAAVLVRHHGAPCGSPGTYIVMTIPTQTVDAVMESGHDLSAEMVEEGVRFTLGSPATAYWTVPSAEETAELDADDHDHSPSGWWYLSFAAADDAEGEDGFLGGAIVEGTNTASAVARAHELRINPGGEVLAVPIPAERLPMFRPELRNRLLTRAEVCEHLEGRSIRDVEASTEEIAAKNGGEVVEITGLKPTINGFLRQ